MLETQKQGTNQTGIAFVASAGACGNVVVQNDKNKTKQSREIIVKIVIKTKKVTLNSNIKIMICITNLCVKLCTYKTTRNPLNHLHSHHTISSTCQSALRSLHIPSYMPSELSTIHLYLFCHLCLDQNNRMQILSTTDYQLLILTNRRI